MKIYVASSWRNAIQPGVVTTLRNHDHQVYDFRAPHFGPGARGVGFHWSDIDPDWKDWTPEGFRGGLLDHRASDGLSADMEGMEWAEVFVLVMPCGRSSHLELGWAIGARKGSIILLSDGEPELMYGMADHLCTNIPEVLFALELFEDRKARP